ncbi:hypothetical protein AOLI_G00276760 [Acnodon oligacanthus]
MLVFRYYGVDTCTLSYLLPVSCVHVCPQLGSIPAPNTSESGIKCLLIAWLRYVRSAATNFSITYIRNISRP